MNKVNAAFLRFVSIQIRSICEELDFKPMYLKIDAEMIADMEFDFLEFRCTSYQRDSATFKKNLRDFLIQVQSQEFAYFYSISLETKRKFFIFKNEYLLIRFGRIIGVTYG